MQTKLNEERLIVRSLKEENSKTKNNLQKELLAQRQQLEMHIAHLNDQHQQVFKFLSKEPSGILERMRLLNPEGVISGSKSLVWCCWGHNLRKIHDFQLPTHIA